MKKFMAVYMGRPEARKASGWESLDENTRKQRFENHPRFAIFPGDSVEIMECLPIPGT